MIARTYTEKRSKKANPDTIKQPQEQQQSWKDSKYLSQNEKLDFSLGSLSGSVHQCSQSTAQSVLLPPLFSVAWLLNFWVISPTSPKM